MGGNLGAYCNHHCKLLEFCEGSPDQRKGKCTISLWGNLDLAPHESSSKTWRIEFGSDYCLVGAKLIRKVILWIWFEAPKYPASYLKHCHRMSSKNSLRAKETFWMFTIRISRYYMRILALLGGAVCGVFRGVGNMAHESKTLDIPIIIWIVSQGIWSLISERSPQSLRADHCSIFFLNVLIKAGL